MVSRRSLHSLTPATILKQHDQHYPKPRSPITTNPPRYGQATDSSDQDVGSDSSTGLSNNQWVPFAGPSTTPRGLFRGRSDTSPAAPSRRVRFVQMASPALVARPRSATRTSFSDEGSWGVLFDSHGRETERMEHVLKKLAGHIVSYWLPGTCLADQ